MRSERVKIPQKTAKEYIKPYHEYDDTGINFYIEKIASLMMFCIFFFFLITYIKSLYSGDFGYAIIPVTIGLVVIIGFSLFILIYVKGLKVDEKCVQIVYFPLIKKRIQTTNIDHIEIKITRRNGGVKALIRIISKKPRRIYKLRESGLYIDKILNALRWTNVPIQTVEVLK